MKPEEQDAAVAELLEYDNILEGLSRLVDATRHDGGQGGDQHHFDSRKDADLHIWTFVRAELHNILCTNSKIYQQQRSDFKKLSAYLLYFIAGLIVGQFSIPFAAAMGMAAAIIVIPFRIGVNAWCKMYIASREAVTPEESRIAFDLYSKLHLEKDAN